MRTVYSRAFVATVLSLSPLHAQVGDDFSQGGWKLFTSTPGKISAKAGEHVLKLTPRESLVLDLIAVTTNPGLFNY